MDWAWDSCGRRNMSLNCAPHSARHSGVPEICSSMDTPWNFWGATMTPICSRTGIVRLVPRGMWRLSRFNRCYVRNLGSLIRTTLEMPIKWIEASGSPCRNKVRPTQCAEKVMVIVVYDTDEIIQQHAVSPKQTVNLAYYCTFIQHHLRPALRRKRRHLVVQNPIILHDNSRSHTAAAVTDLLRRWQWEILEHPPYSPDMIPCDYDLFKDRRISYNATKCSRISHTHSR